MNVEGNLDSGFSNSSQNVIIKLSSFTSSVLEEALQEILRSLRMVGATIRGPIPLPNSVTVLTMNRSPHLNAKSKEKMKLVRHYRVFGVIGATSVEIDSISKIEIPSGVGVEIRVTNRKGDSWK